ncbi:MAG: efflux RND transporter periplasmic adaptor subunit [Allosphingosinicella sp.]|uniref:efflux RND transporter periplasmic adaptor subunit n=1 Tax=Allosphingosinicella sp. TaxID=2823234 RepID=UPI0039280620
MNYESTTWRREALEDVVLDDATLAKRRKRRRLLIAFAIFLVVAIAVVAVMAGRGGDEAAAPAGKAAAPGAQADALPVVTVIVPGRQQVATVISSTGSLAARRDLPVGVPGEGGQVSRVLVEPGDWVRAGQVLATIDRSVQTQEAAQLAAQIQVQRADLALAQSELERSLALVERGFVSQADIQRKTATRDAAAARVRVAEANLGAARARMGRLDIRAPAAGLVLDRNIEAGQVVGPGSGALFRIAQGGEMELLARLPQSDMARVRVGVPVAVTPVGSATSYQGVVWQMSPTIDAQTRQGEARISVPYHRDLRPGGFASAEIRAGAVDAPLLPESAVQSDERGNFVYLVDGNGAVVRRDVRVGEVGDRGVAVVEGLAGDERVVLSAGAFLNPGQRVRPQLAAAAR